ncbi:tetraspanin family protein [Ostertagia ostertagi]
MVYGCANSCVKFFFFLFNLLICVFGALIFGFSLWANLDKNFGSHLADFVRKVDGADHTHIDEIAKVVRIRWVKFFFFLVNLLICVFGALIFGFSLWANLDKNFGSHLADFVRKVDGADHTHIDEIAKPDCFTRISHMVESSGEVIIVIGFILLAVEALSLIFSCILCRASQEVRYAGYYA